MEWPFNDTVTGVRGTDGSVAYVYPLYKSSL